MPMFHFDFQKAKLDENVEQPRFPKNAQCMFALPFYASLPMLFTFD